MVPPKPFSMEKDLQRLEQRVQRLSPPSAPILEDDDESQQLQVYEDDDGGSAQSLRRSEGESFGMPLRARHFYLRGRCGGNGWGADLLLRHRSQRVPGARSKSTAAKVDKSTPLRRNSWRFVLGGSLQRNRWIPGTKWFHAEPFWAR